jgi:hypothetical protein
MFAETGISDKKEKRERNDSRQQIGGRASRLAIGDR